MGWEQYSSVALIILISVGRCKFPQFPSPSKMGRQPTRKVNTYRKYLGSFGSLCFSERYEGLSTDDGDLLINWSLHLICE